MIHEDKLLYYRDYFGDNIGLIRIRRGHELEDVFPFYLGLGLTLFCKPQKLLQNRVHRSERHVGTRSRRRRTHEGVFS
jgi:hypothetical protein